MKNPLLFKYKYAIKIVPIIRAFMALFLVFQSAGIRAQEEVTGTIRGNVINTVSERTLKNVLISIDSLDRYTFTDENGEFVFYSIAPGNYELRTTYPGLTDETVSVSVESGQLTRTDIGMSSVIVDLEKYTVASPLDSDAVAQAEQRYSSNLKSVVATEAYGHISDGNLGYLLSQIPGVAGTIYAGQVGTISIRGIDPSLNSVSFDGNKVSTSTFQSGGDNRQFIFTSINGEDTERVEVIKALTPDLDADSIGGMVNIVPKNALDYAKGYPKFRYKGSVGIRETLGLRDTQWTPAFNLQYTDKLGKDDNIGLQLNFSDTAREEPFFRNTLLFQANGNFGTEPFPDVRYASGIFEIDDIARREQRTWSARIDYKLSDNTRFKLNLRYDDADSAAGPRHREEAWRFRIRAVGPGARATGANGAILPGYTPTFTESKLSTRNEAESFSGGVPTDATTELLTFGAIHDFEKWHIDYDFATSHTDTFVDQSRTGVVRAYATNFGWTIDRSNPYYPQYRWTGGTDIYDPDNYSRINLNRAVRPSKDEITEAKINVTRFFGDNRENFLKFGVKQQDHDRTRLRDGVLYRYTGSGGFAQFVYSDWDLDLVGPSGNRWIPIADTELTARHLAQNPSDWTKNVYNSVRDSFRFDWGIEEDIFSEYAMTQFRPLDKVLVIAGVRHEDTDTKGFGYVQAINQASAADIPDDAKRATFNFGNRRETEGNYNDLFPSLHVKYDPTENLSFRASITTGIGRPSYRNLAPGLTVDEEALTVTSNNPDLKPQYSTNFDLSMSYYFEPLGEFYVGLFSKEIEDFIFRDTITVPTGPDNGFDGEYAGYDWTTDLNGGKGTVEGFEASYRQQLEFLPGILSNLSFIANYTKNKAEGEFAGPGQERVGGTIPRFIPETANLILQFHHKKWQAMARTNYRSKYLLVYNALDFRQRFFDSRTTVDAEVSYSVTENMTIFLNGDNVLGAGQNDGNPGGYIVRTEDHARRILIGVEGRF